MPAADYNNIKGYQKLLEIQAGKFDGIYDGWYCPPQLE